MNLHAPALFDEPEEEGSGGAYWEIAAQSSPTHDAADLNVPVVFRRQPRPISARQRVAYRSGLLLLILSKFNRNAAKLENIHLLTWATRSSRTRRILIAWLSGHTSARLVGYRTDPELPVTISLAIVDGLVSPTGNGQRVKLTDKGVLLANMIDSERDLFRLEKEFLARLGALSDASIARRMGGVSR
ncbi:hypothetical protein ACFY05_42905 [Microtetraspora fusca]|uniref:Winged helix-turn-helix transcriptional regulator n=1 Tax=Microtetraspora fusca TaxID=1997 RepID=A0ABW6VKV7_MICFU